MNQPATFTCVTGMLPHPNADALSIIQVGGLDYQILGRTDEWEVGDFCVYIEPDSVVPNTEEFEWLGHKPKYRRIRAKKIRGLHSFGLLTKPWTLFAVRDIVCTPVGVVMSDRHFPEMGEDVSEELGITHWQPPIKGIDGCTEDKNLAEEFPLIPDLGKFSVDNIQREGALIEEGTLVIVREKLHGQNVRFVWAKDRDSGEYRLFCGLRTWWVQEGKHGVWDLATPEVRQMCSRNPETIFYGELTPCQGDKWLYGGEPMVTFFAARDTQTAAFWRDDAVEHETHEFGLKMAPYIYVGPYTRDEATRLGQGPSVYEGQSIREGIVIQKALHDGQPIFLKSINPEYLL